MSARSLCPRMPSCAPAYCHQNCHRNRRVLPRTTAAGLIKRDSRFSETPRPASDEIETLMVSEVNRDGRFVRGAALDPDDRAAASRGAVRTLRDSPEMLHVIATGTHGTLCVGGCPPRTPRKASFGPVCACLAFLGTAGQLARRCEVVDLGLARALFGEIAPDQHP